MAAAPVVLVARPGQQEMLQAICSRVEIAGILNPVRARLKDAPAPVLTDRTDLLATARICCFLTPYPRLRQDLESCLAHRIHVLSAGPVAFTRAESDRVRQLIEQHRVHLEWGHQHRFSPLFQTLKEQRQEPGFGNPVYLRQVGGGGQGLLPAWWAACQALEQARELLESGLQGLHIAARRKGRQHHIVLTGAMANRASVQLVVAPVHLSPSSDVLLLGSGGMLSSDSVANAPALIGQHGVDLYAHPTLIPEPAWLQHFLSQVEEPEPPRPDWTELTLQHRILRAIRQALRHGQPFQVSLPQ